MRLTSCAILAALSGCLFGSAPVRGDHEAVLVVPGNPQVPVIINGYDASWAVVEGDWGLYRPGHGSVGISFPYTAAYDGRRWHYFPVTGKRPRYGRMEIIPPPNRHLPPRAESFHRFWTNSYDPSDIVTEYPAYDPPPVIVAPTLRLKN